jgi:hypothetical protein
MIVIVTLVSVSVPMKIASTTLFAYQLYWNRTPACFLGENTKVSRPEIESGASEWESEILPLNQRDPTSLLGMPLSKIEGIYM